MCLYACASVCFQEYSHLRWPDMNFTITTFVFLRVCLLLVCLDMSGPVWYLRRLICSEVEH